MTEPSKLQQLYDAVKSFNPIINLQREVAENICEFVNDDLLYELPVAVLCKVLRYSSPMKTKDAQVFAENASLSYKPEETAQILAVLKVSAETFMDYAEVVSKFHGFQIFDQMREFTEDAKTRIRLHDGTYANLMELQNRLSILENLLKEKETEIETLKESKSESEKTIHINVKSLRGEHFHIEANGSWYVENLKHELMRKGASHDEQRLIYQGIQMEDGRRISDYGVVNDCIVHLVYRLRG